jgi:hypothetical protein
LAQARSAWTRPPRPQSGDDILAAGDRGVPQNAVGDELGVFDKVGGVADDARHQV